MSVSDIVLNPGVSQSGWKASAQQALHRDPQVLAATYASGSAATPASSGGNSTVSTSI